MDARTAGPEWSGPVRGPDFFWSGFFWSGPWSGYFGPDFFGPVRGPDISVRFFFGPVRGPDLLVRISLVRSVSGFLVRIIRTGPDFFAVRSVVRILFFQNKKIRTRTGPINIRTEISGPRTGTKKYGPKKSGQRTGPKNFVPKKSGPRIGPDHSGPAVRATMVFNKLLKVAYDWLIFDFIV